MDQHVDTLLPGMWLSDLIIEFFFAYLFDKLPERIQNKISLLYPSVTYFVATFDTLEASISLANEHLSEKDVVFIPVTNNPDPTRVGGTHWSLLVFCRKASFFGKFFCQKLESTTSSNNDYPVFVHFDSSSGLNLSAAKLFIKKISPIVAPSCPEPSIFSPIVPQQVNGSDCGVYVLAFAEYLCDELVAGNDIKIDEMAQIITPKYIKELRRKTYEIIQRLSKERNDESKKEDEKND
ncbi:putative sentrin-specific protease 8 [Monocercomonoides exilis]|uniref:putative sentrin-specific protease 8 n=1 Tax=Monocercomonoides exilis TaxID=2049356 RepID=UPI003559549A|nr:putative sentrin-specific protease 8 [Monocercomonoides exilis]